MNKITILSITMLISAQQALAMETNHHDINKLVNAMDRSSRTDFQKEFQGKNFDEASYNNLIGFSKYKKQALIEENTKQPMNINLGKIFCGGILLTLIGAHCKSSDQSFNIANAIFCPLLLVKSGLLMYEGFFQSAFLNSKIKKQDEIQAMISKAQQPAEPNDSNLYPSAYDPQDNQ